MIGRAVTRNCWKLCVILAAVAGGTKGWELGSGHKYRLTNTLIFREAEPPKSGGDVGFRLTGELGVAALWQDSNVFLLKFELLSPQLWIKSRRAPEPEGFVEHSSKVDEVAERPFFVLWRHGDIEAVYMDPAESASSANLKRGLASLFQYRTLDDEVRQRDASGLCHVAYVTSGDNVVEKRKTACAHGTLPPPKQHPNPVFAVSLESYRNSTYVLTQSLLPESVTDYEAHRMTLVAKSDVGTSVVSERTLRQSAEVLSASAVQANSARHAVMLLKPEYKDVGIELQPVPATCPDAGCPTIDRTIEEYHRVLTASELGTSKSASAFLKLLPLVKNASPEELYKVLKTPRNQPIKMQLLDVFGAASTLPAHQAAMKILRQDETGDETERYLWALSLSPTPHVEVAGDILRRSEETMQNDKVSETYALTAGAMARHYGSAAVIEKARVSLELGLDTCTGEECKLKFLRALRNLKSPAAVPTLLQHALHGSKSISVAAWRALKALPREAVSDEMKRAAHMVFYQVGVPRRDSSARTLALDIILDNEPSKEALRDFVMYSSSDDPAYEVRKYLSQRLKQIAERDERFAEYLRTMYANGNVTLNNYHVRAQQGLSTAFARDFLRSSDTNGSLVTFQEVNSGILKHGIVDVVLESNEQQQTMFSLGLFAGGLSSFASSQTEQTEADDEVATAGMEIDFLDVGVRPFVFFSGQGELLGHVWSGTADQRTPAFQALASLYSHNEYVPLGSGFVAEIDIQGAVSFELAGEIQVSLWSKKAHSLVETDAGVMVHGLTRVQTSFVQSKAEFTMAMEPKLELSTDVDFSGPVALCMRLSQPVTTVAHQVYKIERIPGSRHKLRKTRRSRVHSPGRSYRLNRKNNEMCAKFGNLS
ncbi:PREDICTED: microsomal triglyceride transfer protein large subunit isoform X2 [Vollenhovia emeryi]|uniref:microsomal triglyceride transfer protein large subunit isoform X2 n=1 Tax=Vollenhovia emeryi TaxID=411798 RepID=UPI0005F38C1A|nr:PREDICTED: microsomal triglyceride transfer protein large subunit isoform X2 [Vollenhovia emeryi]XP_011862751.1 PREDICTED: microsomal triglyceride transfer protein large subunit isoform X2 [Vollenhovia emeryi]XP_011862752.1 PREDICTED: microsomal triglyceride transfer protein large subunit isoform X2 [Vollenhovia emeryi]